MLDQNKSPSRQAFFYPIGARQMPLGSSQTAERQPALDNQKCAASVHGSSSLIMVFSTWFNYSSLKHIAFHSLLGTVMSVFPTNMFCSEILCILAQKQVLLCSSTCRKGCTGLYYPVLCYATLRHSSQYIIKSVVFRFSVFQKAF